MLISTDRPAITWTLPTGGAWLTDADALTNGRPASVSRLQWLSGTQDTDSVLTLRGSLDTALVPRVLCLLGLTLPADTLITLSFMRPADSGYTYLEDAPSQRVVQLPDGSRCVWFVLDEGLDAVTGVEFRIHNDVDGDATISADSTLDIGEAWVGGAREFCTQRTLQDELVDPTVRRRSYGSQPFSSPRRPYRSLKIDFSPLADASLPGLRILRGEITQGASVALIPIEDEIYDSALFGEVDSISMQAMSTGRFWNATLSVQEAPAAEAPST